jgi:formylglycine-generating enzyme required for sulfatase activity
MAAVAGGSPRYSRVKTVNGFCLDLTEVTVDAYSACVRGGECTANNVTNSEETVPAGQWCNYGVAGKGNHPMNCVDWGQAATYCHAQGKRLPTMDEWSWADQGGAEERTYPWGEAAPEAQLCWARSNGTCPVGKFPDSDAPGGIHDMAGNVSEWTSTAEFAGHSALGANWRHSNPRDAMTRTGIIRNPGIVGARYPPAPYRSHDLGFRCAK